MFGLCPPSGILNTRKHNVSKARRHILSWVSSKEQWWRLTLSKWTNGAGISSPHLRTETDPVSENLCFLVFRNQDDGRSPKTQWFWVLYTTVRTLQILLERLMFCAVRSSPHSLARFGWSMGGMGSDPVAPSLLFQTNASPHSSRAVWHQPIRLLLSDTVMPHTAGRRHSCTNHTNSWLSLMKRKREDCTCRNQTMGYTGLADMGRRWNSNSREKGYGWGYGVERGSHEREISIILI
jgi:hypothetical protein